MALANPLVYFPELLSNFRTNPLVYFPGLLSNFRTNPLVYFPAVLVPYLSIVFLSIKNPLNWILENCKNFLT